MLLHCSGSAPVNLLSPRYLSKAPHGNVRYLSGHEASHNCLQAKIEPTVDSSNWEERGFRIFLDGMLQRDQWRNRMRDADGAADATD